MTDATYAPPRAEQGPSQRGVPWLAIPVTLVAALILTWATRNIGQLPLLGPIPIAAALLAALTLVIAGALGALPRAASLWPAALLFGFALTFLTIPGGAQVGPVQAQFRLLGVWFLWAPTAWALALAAWLRVPPRGWLAFAGAIGLKSQAVQTGWQFLLPGAGLTGLLPLFELVAAEGGEGSWLWRALTAIPERPASFALALGTAVAATTASLVSFVAFEGPTGAWAAFLDPSSSSFVGDLGSNVSWALVTGAGLAAARAAGPRPAS